MKYLIFSPHSFSKNRYNFNVIMTFFRSSKMSEEKLNKSTLVRQYGCGYETIDRRLNSQIDLL